MQFIAVVVGALVVLLLAPGTAAAAPGDPWVAYVANSVVTKQSEPSAVILRADPATGGLTEISRNGVQGDLFRHPYDIAVAGDGSLLVADMGTYATPTDRRPDGRIIRVDPVTGLQSLVSSGNLLVDPAGLTIAPDGQVYVVENVGTGGQPGVVRVDPTTGAQALVTQGNHLCYPFGIAAEPSGSLVVTNYGDFSSGATDINCLFDFGALVRVSPGSQTQSIVSRNASPWGNLLRNPLGVVVEPAGRILVVNPEGANALVAIHPATGVQDAATANTATDRLVLPQRAALTPDGDVVVTDFTLDDLEGGLVLVDLPGGAQSLLRQDRRLFNNPLGVAVVANRPPAAAISAGPVAVRPGAPVTFSAAGSADPEGLPLRYLWDLDGNGSFETDSGPVPVASRAYDGASTLTARVRATDPHGASAVAGAPVTVDALRPVISALKVRGSAISYRLSEPARVTIRLQRKRGARWRTVRVLRDEGRAGRNLLRLAARRGRASARPGHARYPAAARARYRAAARAIDAVGNSSTTVRRSVSTAAVRRLGKLPRRRP